MDYFANTFYALIIYPLEIVSYFSRLNGKGGMAWRASTPRIKQGMVILATGHLLHRDKSVLSVNETVATFKRI